MGKLIKPLSPCKDCKKRQLHCHSTCEDYIEFVKLNAEYKETKRSQIDEYSQYRAEVKNRLDHILLKKYRS